MIIQLINLNLPEASVRAHPLEYLYHAGISAVFFALHVYKYQMLSFLVLAMSVTVGGFLAWSLVGGLIHRPLPAFPRVLSEGITEAEARRVVEKLVPYVNKMLAYVHRILSGKDALMSVAISAGLFFASRVLATVSVLGLAYAAVILMFTVPKVYDMHSAEIDGAVNMFRQKATFLYVLINDSSLLLGFNPGFWYSLARSLASSYWMAHSNLVFVFCRLQV